MNENTKKWEKTGLLPNTSEDIKDELANDLEELAKLLIQKYNTPNEKVKTRGGFVAGTVLPIMVRLYNENVIHFKRPMAYELFLDFEAYVDKHGEVSIAKEIKYVKSYIKHLKESK